MFTRIAQCGRRGAAKLLARVCTLGVLGCLAATQAGAANAYSDSGSYASIVTGSTGSSPFQVIPMAPVLPSTVRAVRTPNRPAPAPTLTVSAGRVVYSNSPRRHSAYMVFTVHLSRVYKNPVQFNYAATPNIPGAAGEFQNLMGTATIRRGTANVIVRVPITGPVNVPGGAVVLSLTDPSNATIAKGQGVGVLKAGLKVGTAPGNLH